jgi:hypothetical protein
LDLETDRVGCALGGTVETGIELNTEGVASQSPAPLELRGLPAGWSGTVRPDRADLGPDFDLTVALTAAEDARGEHALDVAILDLQNGGTHERLNVTAQSQYRSGLATIAG